MNNTNPILDELHAARQKLLADAGGDLHRYIAESTRRALQSGRAVAEPNPRDKQTAGTAKDRG